jgi:hypothetical protein
VGVAGLQPLDGVCKYYFIYKDGCEERQKSNVQFLFLFDDCVAGAVCGQGVAPPPKSPILSFPKGEEKSRRA